MVLLLGLFITFALWLVDKSGYMQFTFQELLYPTYAALGLVVLRLIIAFITIGLFRKNMRSRY
nr:MAG TPA: hypothetical protein [Caudoviricetes sp.]